MRTGRWVLVVLGAVGLAFAASSGDRAGRPAIAQVAKDMPRVIMFDSNASFTAGNDYLGAWGFMPAHLTVTQGEQIEFDNPAGNNFPHTVTSITWNGQAPDRSLTSGQLFTSSPTRDDYIMPGAAFVLDTSTLMPGQYVYYCVIHPWMVGTFTLTPAS